MQRLLPPHLVLALLVLMVALTLMLPVADFPSGWLRLVGVVPVLAGLALTLSGSNLFTRVATNIKTFDDPEVLVTAGPFRWTRNPMYLGFLLLLSGVAWGLGAASAWTGPLLFLVAADRWYIPFEERRMQATFGDDYTRYQGTVRRWVGTR